MRVIYLDSLLLLNGAADYFLLRLTARLAGEGPRRLRLALGALLGAGAGAALYLLPMGWGLGVLLRGLLCLGMCALAFGARDKRRLLRLGAVLLILTLGLGGAVMALQSLGGRCASRNGSIYSEISTGVMLLCFTGFYALSGLVFGEGRGFSGRKTARVTAAWGGRTVTFRALADSGNLLRDPLSGSGVILLSRGLSRELFPGFDRGEKSGEGLLSRLGEESGQRFWLVPGQTAGGRVLLPVFRPERVEIDGVPRTDVLLALGDRELAAGCDCRALMGGSLC